MKTVEREAVCGKKESGEKKTKKTKKKKKIKRKRNAVMGN